MSSSFNIPGAAHILGAAHWATDVEAGISRVAKPGSPVLAKSVRDCSAPELDGDRIRHGIVLPGAAAPERESNRPDIGFMKCL
jgi:hypothetical protein